MSTADETTWANASSDPFAEPVRRKSRLWRWLPLILGVIVFEMTTDPMIAVAVACLKFGWDELMTAIWLVRTDPKPTRGRTCALFHAAIGFGKMGLGGLAVTLVAVMCMVMIAWLGLLGRIPARAVLQQMAGGLIVLVAASFVGLILSYAGIVRAVLGGVRVWIGPEVNQARKRGVWPPENDSTRFYGPRSNRLYALLGPGAILTAELIFILGYLVIPWPNGPMSMRACVAVGVACFAILLAIARGSTLIGKTIAARSPLGCWLDFGDRSGHES